MTDIPVREFGWWDMWVHRDDDPREAGGPVTGERDVLVRYLRDRRLTLDMKCAGLDAEALARRSVEPSDLSLLGLVRHLSDGERYWFRRVAAGQDAEPRYRTADGRSAAFAGAVADPGVVAEAWRSWRAEIEFAEAFVAATPDLGRTGADVLNDQRVTLREVVVHMIEEYARHCGHADFLRERIDGRVGQ